MKLVRTPHSPLPVSLTKAVITYACRDKMQPADIAERLGITNVHARVILFRARKRRVDIPQFPCGSRRARCP